MKNLIPILLLITWLNVSAQSPYIHVDQFGYQLDAKKVAILTDPQIGLNSNLSYSPAAQLELRNATNNGLVQRFAPTVWNNGAVDSDYSGDRGWRLDFSSITTEGNYYIQDPSSGDRSATFAISDNCYNQVLRDATRMFYYNRCNFAKSAPYAESPWIDNRTNFGQDARSRSIDSPNNTSLEKDLSGGWFDAGDYNKYVTFTMTTLHNLLWAYQENPAIFTDNFNIPESGNGIPDLLDEIKYELDWLRKMNNSDGSTHAKIGSNGYGVNEAAPPSTSENSSTRYYEQTCPSASLTIASVFAHAAKVFGTVSQLRTYANSLEAEAERAWAYVLPFYNNGTIIQDCDTGRVVAGDSDFETEERYDENMIAAAIYLFDLTGDSGYNNFVIQNYRKSLVFGANSNTTDDDFWGINYIETKDAFLHYSTISGRNTQVANAFVSSLTTTANNNYPGFFGSTDNDLFRSFMPTYFLGWGSNNQQATMGILNFLVQKYNTNGNTATYLEKNAEHIHYLHGKNPIDMCYLSSMEGRGAEKSANEIYHAWFGDGTVLDNNPAPGFLAGGPNTGYSGGSALPAGQPILKAYANFNDVASSSWEVTEPGIYYQAAYIRNLAQVMTLGDSDGTDSVVNNDLISNITAPTSVRQGETVTVEIDYEAAGTRDILILFEIDSNPWTSYAQVIESVSTGSGTLNVPITIPTSTPIANDAYQYQVILAPTGGGWPERLANQSIGDVDVTQGTHTPDCQDLDNTSFENGETGVWSTSGNNAVLYRNASFASTGSYSVYISGDNGANSSLVSNNLNLGTANSVTLDFSLYPYAVEAGDRLVLECSPNGNNYTTFSNLTFGTDFSDRQRVEISRTLNLPGTGTSYLRIRSISGNADYFLIDDINIERCQSGTYPQCNVGATCNDGDPCTTGERFDANCNCTGGTLLDSDYDGVCNSEDICPGYDDNQDSDNDGTPDGCDNCNSNLAGQSCDDGNACTTGETYDNNCNCNGGQYTDNDGDGYCVGEDSNDNDACVPDDSGCAGTGGGTGTGADDCYGLSYTDFENSNLEIWNKGGSKAILLNSASYANTGTYSLYLYGNDGQNSSLVTSYQDFSDHDALQFSISILPYLIESGDQLILEYSATGTNYQPFDILNQGADLNNSEWLYHTVTLDLTDKEVHYLRIRAQGSEVRDYFILDDLYIEGCATGAGGGSTGGGAGCSTNNACDDGDNCTMGEYYDADCNCVGGQYIDNDNDGYCVGEDADDNNACVPDNYGNNCGCQTEHFADFESDDTGVWIDGGSSARTLNYAQYANSGNYSMYVQGNSGKASSIYTSRLYLSSYSSVSLNFSLLPYAVENGDQLALEYSTNGSNYTTYKLLTYGTDFSNSRVQISAVLDLAGMNVSHLRIRAQGNASADYFILDDIEIEGCYNSTGRVVTETANTAVGMRSSNELIQEDFDVVLFPNPASTELNIRFNDFSGSVAQLQIYSMDGQVLRSAEKEIAGINLQLDITELPDNVYFLNLVTETGHTVTKKFIKTN